MLKGSIVALITPFTEQGELDLEALTRLIKWHVEKGTDGLVCCGTTGEDPTLSEEERILVIQTTLKAARKRIPVIAGTGTNNTRLTVERTRRAQALGVDGALVIVPYYNRPTFEGCLAHFTEVGKIGLPTLLYYHPGRTGVVLSAQQLAALCQIPSIQGIKDASGSIAMIESLKRETSFPIFSGDDALALDQLKKGAAGVISVVANLIPDQWQAMIELALRGEFEQAKVIFEEVLPLCHALMMESNPQGVKYAASLLGKSGPYLRLPLVQPRETTRLAIERALLACQER